MTALLLAWLALAPALAAPADIAGSWALDADASDDIDDILAARGATWMERQAIKHVPVTHVITHTEDAVVIAIESPIYSRSDTLKTDNRARTRESKRLGTLTLRNYWDNEVLVTVTDMVLPDGVPATLTVTRTLVDPDTMHMRLELVATDGRQMEGTRVLRRTEDASAR
ncbi:MAG: hypothetical protein H6739_23440 [Alphaproteobacteria bacterium]|nr:hypothetical protein [Alphaproteobacteria bacterium]